jgi:hypothetical protein
MSHTSFWSTLSMGGLESVLKSVIRASRNYPEVQRTEGYILAQTTLNPFRELMLEMGPNCNLSCAFCYAGCGPRRRGLPDAERTESVLAQAIRQGSFKKVYLGDGEPLRERNREVMKVVVSKSSRLSVDMTTNGSFASSPENAIKWFEFLAENGYDLGADIKGRRNMIVVSCGMMYAVPISNYANIINGARSVFPKIDLGRHLVFRFLFTFDRREPGLFNRVRDLICTAADAKEIDEAKDFAVTTRGVEYTVRFKLETQTDLELIGKHAHAQGYAKTNPRLLRVHKNQERVMTLNEFMTAPEIGIITWVGHDGRVAYGGDVHCTQEGNTLGNIDSTSLRTLTSRASRDPVFQAYRLGGVKFLYFLAQQIDPKYQVTGYLRCDVCNDLFGNSRRLGSVRNRLLEEGVTDTYRDYIAQFKFRKGRALFVGK